MQNRVTWAFGSNGMTRAQDCGPEGTRSLLTANQMKVPAEIMPVSSPYGGRTHCKFDVVIALRNPGQGSEFPHAALAEPPVTASRYRENAEETHQGPTRRTRRFVHPLKRIGGPALPECRIETCRVFLDLEHEELANALSCTAGGRPFSLPTGTVGSCS